MVVYVTSFDRIQLKDVRYRKCENCKFAVQIEIKYNPNIHFLFSN